MILDFNRSHPRYDEPWYDEVSHGMAHVQIFRRRDLVRPVQPPSGGGSGNPAGNFHNLPYADAQGHPPDVTPPRLLEGAMEADPWASDFAVGGKHLPRRRRGMKTMVTALSLVLYVGLV